MHADIEFFNEELTPLRTPEAAVLAAAGARPNVQAALDATAVSPDCYRDGLLSSLLSRIDAEIANSELVPFRKQPYSRSPAARRPVKSRSRQFLAIVRSRCYGAISGVLEFQLDVAAAHVVAGVRV